MRHGAHAERAALVEEHIEVRDRSPGRGGALLGAECAEILQRMSEHLIQEGGLHGERTIAEERPRHPPTGLGKAPHGCVRMIEVTLTKESATPATVASAS